MSYSAYTTNVMAETVTSLDQGLVVYAGTALAIGGLVLGAILTWYKKKGKQSNPLDPVEFRKFKLVLKKSLTKDVPCPVVLFRFALPTPTATLNLPIGQHVSLRYTDAATGRDTMRSYTPTSSAELDKGYFDLVVKIYPEGIMGQYLNRLQAGKDMVDVRGPKGKFLYQCNKYSHIGMIAGGSGITPMYQIMHHVVLHEKVDRTKISLVYGNMTEADIILRDELQDIVKTDRSRYSVYHVLNKPPSNWKQGSGFVTAEMIRSNLPAPTESSIVIVLCGPTPMVNKMMTYLVELGYNKETQIFCF